MLFTISDRRPIARRLLEVLLRHTKSRNTKGHEFPLWPKQETEAMWKAVCEERAKLGKGPVPLADVETADQCATGHVDWAKKFSLSCEELVLK